MSESLTLPQELIDEMVAHARADNPNECCGVIVRARSGPAAGALTLFRTVNAEDSPYRFSIPAAQLHYLFRLLEDQDADLLVVYHSHTMTEARPSPTDANFSRLLDGPDPWPYWVLVSLAQEPPPVRAWRMEDGGATEIALEAGTLPPGSRCARLRLLGAARRPQVVEEPLPS